MFTSSDLSAMRASQLAHMPDVCRRMAYSRTFDSRNAPVETWTEVATDLACGLEMASGSERPSAQMTVVVWDATLRLEISDAWDAKDRVKVTHRFGEALATPLVYGLVAPIQRGPSGMRLRLSKVDV